MAKRKTTKKPVEPVIEYVDPETNLEAEAEVPHMKPTFVVTAESIKDLEHYFVDNADDDLFACMKRRRDKEK